MNNLVNRMKEYATKIGMNFDELCERACYDFDPKFSEEIVEIACERLGISEDDDYDFSSEEYQNTIDGIYAELTNAD